MFAALILFYEKFCGELEKIGFGFNPYNPCVDNKIKVGKEHTVILHVDYFMSSHVNPKVNNSFKEYINCNYGKHGEVNSNRGKLHYYLGMTFDFTEKRKVKVNKLKGLLMSSQWK